MSRLLGMRVVVSDVLPAHPSPGEDGRRIVRHGMADVLAWLGEEVGPPPGEPINMLQADDTIYVSATTFRQLRDVAGPFVADG